MGYNIWGKQVSIQKKIVSGPRVRVRSLYKKKITIFFPTDKGDPGRLTIIANKCSIIRNAPCRMNMHPPLPLPPSSSSIWAPPPPHARPSRHRTHVALRWFVWRCTCEEQGPRFPKQPQSLHQLGSSRWAKWLSNGPLPGLWYGSGGGGADAEGR
jgi:hypothetical protein